jgi:hypothetical protein
LLFACAGILPIVYDWEIQDVAGTPVGDGWIRVDVPGGPPTSIEVPVGTLRKPVYSELDTRGDSSVARKRHPAYRIRTLKILDGEPDPRFADFGPLAVGGRPARQVRFVSTDPRASRYGSEGQVREKGSVWPRVIQSVRFTSADRVAP